MDDHPADPDDPLAADLLGDGVARLDLGRIPEGLGGEIREALDLARLEGGVEDHLGHAVAVAQIDEDAAAEVTTVGYPAEEDDFLADVAGAELAAVMGALELVDETGHDG